ncbi:hypothetical protein OIU76_000853 [Salix suchowensis]|nr:hypothetical protein OIU76_000853 [Salix suchowensis]
MSLLSDLINLNLSGTTKKIIAEYIWIGGSGMDLRSKARTLDGVVSDPQKLPKWNYDGSSTGQAPGEDSEVILYPQAIFKDPFRRGNNILVMCDAYTPAGEPIPTNKRYNAAKIFSHPDVAAEVPWYGIEQEYTLLQKDLKWPIGWPVGGYPGPQGPYYCGAGADKAFGRDVVDSHYKACLYAGINISGINGEVMPGQWEFQVGPFCWDLSWEMSCGLPVTFLRGSQKLLEWSFRLIQNLSRETGMELAPTQTTVPSP